MRSRGASPGLRVISGGQTGVDRAALAVAVDLGIPYGGWCPTGGWAEDHSTPPGVFAEFPLLRETGARDPAVRTALNVREADAVLVISTEDASSAGTAATVREAAASRTALRVLLIDLEHPLERLESAREGVAQLCENLGAEELRLNIAGPRESEAPGIGRAAAALLREVLAPFGRGA